ncbi:MAG TPA: DUF2239 family protein [Alphaproteobacteria bacterium]|jgi:hypothetical protein|nr:DUF2239 family protein [Alphaproteobacteria bacterium]
MDELQPSWSVFQGTKRIAAGALADAVLAAKAAIDGGGTEAVMVLDDLTAERVEIDFRNDIDLILSHLPKPVPAEPAPDAPRGRGRPKMGVVAREVTLLPRHWEWLGRQPGGASVALRKLVEEARHTHRHRDRVRQSQEAAYRFMSIMAGDRAGFEEATRALFAGSHARFDAITGGWPTDIRDHAQRLAADAFVEETE